MAKIIFLQNVGVQPKMKTVSDDLFQLIKALTKQEKRYFKLHASRHVIGRENKYVKLFDAIDKQSVYNENQIKKKFNNAPITRQLHVAKNYLRQMILASLRNYHESKAEDKFYTYLRNAQLLFNKGLYTQSEKALNKAKKSAADHERFLQLLEIFRWEHQIAHSQNDFNWLEHYVDKGIQQEFKLLEKYRNFLEFQALNDRVFIPYWRKGAIRTEEEKRALEELFEQPLFQKVDNAQSFYARYFYHNSRFSFHFFLGDYAQSYEHIQKLVNMFAQLDKKKIKGKLVRNYSSALINQYIVQSQLGLTEAIPHTLEQLRKVPTDSAEQKRRLVIRSLNLEIDFYINTGQFRAGLQQIVPHLDNMRKLQREINKQQRLGLYYNLAYLHFGAGNYDQALDWINELLNDPDLKTREDIHCFGRLLNLIIHYELGNDQLLEYIVKSTYRFLSNRKRLFKVESVMLKLMRHYPKWLTPKEKQRGFQALIKELKALKQQKLEKRAFEYFDFISWMESQTGPEGFEALVQRGMG